MKEIDSDSAYSNLAHRIPCHRGTRKPRNDTPLVCTLLDNSSTFWRLLAARPGNSLSNPMKPKYYSLVLLVPSMHIFCTGFSGVVRFRVLVPRIRLLNVLRSAPCDASRFTSPLELNLCVCLVSPARAGKPAVCPRLRSIFARLRTSLLPLGWGSVVATVSVGVSLT